MITKFYLDTEYTNGNFYLGDIFEIALISEESGNAFHTLIKVPTKVSSYTKFMCRITDEILQSEGLLFNQSFDAMIDFITEEAKGDVVIIAHSGFLFDFPLLTINCLKNKCNTDVMKNYLFIDSLKILQKEEGINHNQLSLEKLANKVLDKIPVFHSAFNDAKTLMLIFQQSPYKNILSQNMMNTFSINSINQYVCSKMPISIDDLYKLCLDASSVEYLMLLLCKYTHENTALKKSIVNKICHYYFKQKNKK